MPSPLVSILIPVWNRVNIIEETIRSALAQTVDDLEVVVVDNASTDGTWEAIQRVAELDTRVKPLRNDVNVGPVRNWRRAAEAATGKYGKILWSDDLIMPDFLAKTLPVLEDPAIGFVWTGVQIFNDAGEQQDVFYADPEREVDSANFIRRVVGIDPGPHLPVSPGCALMRLDDLSEAISGDIANRIGSDFAMHGIGNDLLAFLLIAAKYPRLVHLPDVLSRFRAHAGSISIHTRWGKCALMYRATMTGFLDGPGRSYLSTAELALFNAHSEAVRLRFCGEYYGFRSWKDFHAPGADEGQLDEQKMMELLNPAIEDGRKELAILKHPAPLMVADEAVDALMNAYIHHLKRNARLTERNAKLKEQVQEARSHNEKLSLRLKSLLTRWTRLGWNVMPWTKPEWRHNPLGK